MSDYPPDIVTVDEMPLLGTLDTYGTGPLSLYIDAAAVLTSSGGSRGEAVAYIADLLAAVKAYES